jgi:hypothetical protein
MQVYCQNIEFARGCMPCGFSRLLPESNSIMRVLCKTLHFRRAEPPVAEDTLKCFEDSVKLGFCLAGRKRIPAQTADLSVIAKSRPLCYPGRRAP